MKKILWTTYIIFFLFTIYHGMYASKTFDGAISHSYDKGMEYPAKVARLQELGWKFKAGNEKVIAGKACDFVLQITDKEGNPVRGAQVSMEVSRPASREALPPALAGEQPEGDYMARIMVPAYGHWLVNVKINRQEEEFHYEYKVYATKGEINANG